MLLRENKTNHTNSLDLKVSPARSLAVDPMAEAEEAIVVDRAEEGWRGSWWEVYSVVENRTSIRRQLDSMVGEDPVTTGVHPLLVEVVAADTARVVD